MPLVTATEDGSLGVEGTRHAAARGYLDEQRPARDAVRLRARRHAARGRAARREPRAPLPREPRSLDGLRRRHLPRLRGLDPQAGRGARQVPLRLHRGARLRQPPRGVGVKLAVEIAGHPLQEPAARGLRHVRLRRRVRGHARPREPRRHRLEGALPRAARRLPDTAHRRDAFGASERDRPAGRRRPELRPRRAAAPRQARHERSW